jgi:hypothetical protein
LNNRLWKSMTLGVFVYKGCPWGGKRYLTPRCRPLCWHWKFVYAVAWTD